MAPALSIQSGFASTIFSAVLLQRSDHSEAWSRSTLSYNAFSSSNPT